MNTQERTWTVNELWQWAGEHPDRRYELVNGQLVEMHPPGGTHGRLALRLGRLLGDFVEGQGLGEMTVETGYHPADDQHNLFAPDVAFIRADRAPSPWPDGYVPTMPDLAVEIVSPNDRPNDVQAKVKRYLEAGTPHVWVVDPGSETVTVHTAAGREGLEKDDTLPGGDVLPGFALRLENLFR
jgi:Uma2 family endonuclease